MINEPVRRIHHVECDGEFVLSLTFSNGASKRVDVKPLLTGPVFKPLLDPDYFARVQLDSVAGTVVWPNGADFAPEALIELPNLS